MINLLNIIFTKKVKYSIFFIILFSLYIYLCAISYVEAISNGLENNLFRLHVIANSNSEEDQNLKYIVRDNLIEYLNTLTSNYTTKDEVVELAKQHQNDFYKIAKQTIENNGYNYNVEIEIGNFDFPTKKYGDITIPAGLYDALRVKIGNAEGQNWWCVMFPPLCFVDVSSGIVPDDSKHILQNNLSDEEYRIISDNSNNIKFKFKLIEFLQNSSILTAKK